MDRLVTISWPQPGNPTVKSVVVSSNSPYEAVQSVSDHSHLGSPPTDRYGACKIGDIIPIHNPAGLRDHKQIDEMHKSVLEARHIMQSDGLPNIKLVVAPNNKLLLFDGHHSLLAYYRKQYERLSDVPYIVVSNPEGAAVSINDLTFFFPEKQRNLVTNDWGKYVVNWQDKNGLFIEERLVATVEELSQALGKRDESSR